MGKVEADTIELRDSDPFGRRVVEAHGDKAFTRREVIDAMIRETWA